MTYQILHKSLHRVADATRQYFENEWGIRRFEVERQVTGLGFAPTLHATTRDFHDLLVEVHQKAYLRSLDRVVLDCQRLGLPVKLFTSIPKGLGGQEHQADLRFARDCGVGVVEVDEAGGVTVVSNALSLSLLGVRQVPRAAFPDCYRNDVWNAQRLFTDGQPGKGCSILYDLIEDLCRRIAECTLRRGFWKTSSKKKVKLDTCPWANVIDLLVKHLDRSGSKCPALKKSLFDRISGVIPNRHKTGHKPKTKQQLIDRDRRLRTWFEEAQDAFEDLMKASKPLRIHR